MASEHKQQPMESDNTGLLSNENKGSSAKKYIFILIVIILAIIFVIIGILMVTGIISITSSSSSSSSTEQKYTVSGLNMHGLNQYNGEKILNYSKVSIRYNSWFGPIYYISTFTGSGDVEYPTSSTNRSNLLGTSNQTQLMWPNIPIKYETEMLLSSVGVLDSNSENVGDRYPIHQYSDDNIIGQYRVAKQFNFYPTLEDWEKIRGTLEISCDDDNNEYTLSFNIKNAFPKSVYSVMEQSVFNAFTVNETVDGYPPELPNIILTDHDGNGNAIFNVGYCPYKMCTGREGEDCVVQYMLAYHYDFGTWSGVVHLSFTHPMMPIGIITGFQMVFPMFQQ